MGAQIDWVYSCGKCRSRFKLRTTSKSIQVAWILLDRSFYEGRPTFTVFPYLLTQESGEFRCPVCGSKGLSKLQSTLAARDPVPPVETPAPPPDPLIRR